MCNAGEAKRLNPKGSLWMQVERRPCTVYTGASALVAGERWTQGACFSKGPGTFRARRQILKSKPVE